MYSNRIPKETKTFNELIKNEFSVFNQGTSSSAIPSTNNDKVFYGTLTYSFVDYYYKLAKYKSSALGSNTSNYTTLSSDQSKPNYFSNIPQKFKYKNLGTSGSESDNSDIDTVFKKVTDKK